MIKESHLSADRVPVVSTHLVLGCEHDVVAYADPGAHCRDIATSVVLDTLLPIRTVESCPMRIAAANRPPLG